MESQIILKIEEISNKLMELQNLLENKSRFTLPNCEIECNKENYIETVSKSNKLLLKIKRGIDKRYYLPLLDLNSTLHWEIANEFILYFSKNNSIQKINVEKAPGLRSKGRADLFFIANNDNWYWVEVQTTLSNKEIEKKIKDAIQCSGEKRYTEYILIFPKEFKKESLFKSTMLKVEGNPYTNKLRIMLYSDGNFETVLEPRERTVKKGSMADLFGKSL